MHNQSPQGDTMAMKLILTKTLDCNVKVSIYESENNRGKYLLQQFDLDADEVIELCFCPTFDIAKTHFDRII